MYIIVGLGNPGKKYENTKHNVGFMVLDYLSEKHGIKINKIKHKALVGEGNLSGQKVLFVKPQTYMNLSGNSVRELLSYYKEDVDKLIVIYDDIDIPMGSLRIRKKGSAGTHNGMKSIIYDIQSDQFSRIRIGIGGDNKGDLAGYVIGGFHKEDFGKIREAVNNAALSVECILEKGIDVAMGTYNITAKAGQQSEEKQE